MSWGLGGPGGVLGWSLWVLGRPWGGLVVSWGSLGGRRGMGSWKGFLAFNGLHQTLCVIEYRANNRGEMKDCD